MANHPGIHKKRFIGFIQRGGCRKVGHQIRPRTVDGVVGRSEQGNTALMGVIISTPSIQT
jgi:ABC-type phosphonate transport system ATPase subunit